MQITSEIFQVGGGGMTSYEDAAVYLINFDGHAALVDAGCGGSTDKLLDNIRSCGVKALAQRVPCRIVAHELDAPFLEKGDNTVTGARWYGSSLQAFEVGQRLCGSREMIDLGDRGIEAVHIPGHSPGSVAFVTESEGLKVLFGQDVHGPLDSSIRSNRQDYIQSLHLLLSLGADILCEGHYGVYEGKKKVEDFIRSFL
jgi:glyoxylase-like metal-dependent hydrolase (beta-lactamase superfamily II)